MSQLGSVTALMALAGAISPIFSQAGSARLFCGHKEMQMLRFDSKNSGTKLPGHTTLIFSADIRWKAFATKKTVTPFVESVKSTQLSEADRVIEESWGPFPNTESLRAWP